MKTIIITGGAGFIGSHLCEYILENDKDSYIICVDNLFTGSKENIKHLLNNERFEFIVHDIIEPLFLDNKNIEQIYNLACPASPIHYQFNAIRTIKANTIGVINMLGIAKKHKARILQASTSEIYGDPTEHPQKESYRGNVNTIGPRSCYSEDTEVLTKEGWKFFKDLNYDDRILTLGKNNLIEYQKPLEIIKEKYVGELICFKNAKINLKVTPNHNMYVRKRDSKIYGLIPAFENIIWERAEMKKNADWICKEKRYFYLPPVRNNKYGHVEKIDMDVWLEFFGYYISEGCVHLRKRKRLVNKKEYDMVDYNILIAQDRKNKEERKKIEECLRKMPFTFFSSDDHQFRICNKQLATYLLRFGKAREKYIPKELKNLSKRQLRILFDSLMLGDGSKKGDTFYSSSIQLIGDMQEILLKINMAGGIIAEDKRKENLVFHLGILRDIKKDFLTPKYPKRHIENYDGFVYCVSVPNHVVYVRKYGKALFCGNCYDEGKRVAETLFFDYNRQNKVDIKVVRIFNTYGPRMAKNDGRVVSNFILQALKNEDITIYGDGKQTRSFCYISDLVGGLYKMMNSENFQGPVNLGNPTELTILEIAEKILQLTGSNSKIIFKELPQDDPKQRQPDITLAKQKLEWEPKIELDEGLKKTIEYFKNI